MKSIIYLIMLLSFLSSCNRFINRGANAPKTTKTNKGNIPKGNGAAAPTGSESPLVKQAGIRRYYLNIEGTTRTFLVQLPKGYDASKTYPVVFFFHGIRGRDTGWVKNQGANAYVDKYGYIAVYGQGANGGVWDIGGYYPLPKVDEPAFVTGMYNWLKENTKIDTKRVYAIGSSNGGLLVHNLAVRTNMFAAIAPVAGSLYIDEMKSTASPVAILQIHGQLDKTIPYNGGKNQYDFTFLSAQNSVKTWAQVNGCNSEPTVTNLLGGKVIEYNFTGCKTGKPAILYSLPNTPHKVLQSFSDANWIFTQVFDFFKNNPK